MAAVKPLLTPELQKWLVIRFARGYTGRPSMVHALFQEAWNRPDITISCTRNYDGGVARNRSIYPNANKRAAQLSQELIDLYDAEHAAYIREMSATHALCRTEGRIAAKLQRIDDLKRIIDERGAQSEDIAGGETGLLVKDYRGKDATRMVTAVDVPLLREISQLEREIAEELGQYKNQSSVSLNVTDERLAGLSMEQLKEIEAILAGEGP